ncbi:MAG: HAD hydrolase-like protein [Lysobacterales bacterium]|jgi:2-haloalkanoic acid dehalogenase type II
MPGLIQDFDVLTFDCYGTLIDWETGIWDALQPMLMYNGTAVVHRGEALGRFAAWESRLQAEFPGLPYPDLLGRVHGGIAGDFGLETTAELDDAFGASVPGWPAFPDTADALRALKERYRLVILSNVDRGSFTGSNRKLGVSFDAVYTAEEIGSWKPDPANFDYLVAHVMGEFGLAADCILHTAQSLRHDIAPARAHGLSCAWIDRHGLSKGGGWGATAEIADRPEADFLFHSLAELAEAAGTTH